MCVCILLWCRCSQSNERKIYLARNYPEQEKDLQHEAGFLHLWLIWPRYKIFIWQCCSSLLIRFCIGIKRFSELQRTRKRCCCIHIKKRGQPCFSGNVYLNPVTISLSLIHMYTCYEDTVCQWHQLDYNQEHENKLHNSCHNDRAYGHPVNFHISDRNFLSARMIRMLWSRHLGVKCFHQDEMLMPEKRLEKKIIFM